MHCLPSDINVAAVPDNATAIATFPVRIKLIANVFPISHGASMKIIEKSLQAPTHKSDTAFCSLFNRGSSTKISALCLCCIAVCAIIPYCHLLG